jgi:hypothetical protein
MSGNGNEKNPPWYYVVMAFNALMILFVIGMLRELLSIY